LEKIIGIQKHAGKVRKLFFFAKKTQKSSHPNAPEVVGDAFW
jgi:hypothetical protein